MTKAILHHRRNQLSMRLMLVTLLYSLIIATLVSGIRIYWLYLESIDGAYEQLAQVEASYTPSLAASLWEVNNPQINVLLDGIAQFPHIGVVQLTDEIGTVWTRNTLSDKKHNHTLIIKKIPLSYQENNTQFDLGELQIELSANAIVAGLSERAIGIAISTSIILLFTVAIIFLLFQRWVTRHLEHMATFAQQLHVNNLDQPLRLERHARPVADELDLVVDSINQMQASIKAELFQRAQIEQELRQHKDNLENSVKERTAELSAKNQLLEHQAAELETQNNELDAYAHTVAHDLKTPLTTIVGRSQLLLAMSHTLTPQQIHESHTSIHRTALKMTNIINALLLLASIRREGDIQPVAIDVKAAAKEACDRVNHHAQETNATIKFTGDWLPALGFGQWVEEVWVNYISNAIKYGGNEPQIEIGCQQQPNGFHKYWVRDHGPGIAVPDHAQLFIQFSRINATTSDGHGLGLSIVKRIIERLHGQVGYENAPGGGSIFWFTLPADK